MNENREESPGFSRGECQLRSATQDEKCKRPLTPHPLSNRIIVGKNFLEKLAEKERKEILSYLIL